MSFKVERHHNHVVLDLVHTLTETQLVGVINQVWTILVKHILQAKTELYFWTQLEERHIEITSHAHSEHHIAILEPQLFTVILGKVLDIHGSSSEIGTHVVVTLSTHLQVDGHNDVGGLDILALLVVILFLPFRVAPMVQVAHHLVAEVQSRRNPQVEMLRDAVIGQHIHTEAR